MTWYKISFHATTNEPLTEADRLELQVRCSGIVENGVGVNKVAPTVARVSATVEAENSIEAGNVLRAMAAASGLPWDFPGVTALP